MKTTFGAHVLDFIDIKAIEVHNNYEYLTVWSKPIALYTNMACEHDSWVKLDVSHFFSFLAVRLILVREAGVVNYKLFEGFAFI